MSNLVLYRKYRPKSWSEVMGQEHIVRTLTNALKLNRVGHAYLFTGPRGTGKTTLARLLAKSLNCVKREDFEPCNKCGLCEEIAVGKALDLIEIDAASNRGIDEIRQLKEGIKFSPAIAKYKVFIIDEVHMLTKEAFNALLKTLEEPPAHAVFVLATTEVHKVPATILSRVQRFDFRHLTIDEIFRKLKKIAELEKIKIEEPALKLIARYAQGSSRDAESLLEQFKVWGSDEVSVQNIEALLGIVDFEKVKKLADFLAAKDIAKAIDFIGRLMQEGRDLEMFLKELQSHFRRLMILKIDPALSSIVSQELTGDQIGLLEAQIIKFSLGDLSRALKILMSAQQEMRLAPIPSLPLELAVIEIINSGSRSSVNSFA